MRALDILNELKLSGMEMMLLNAANEWKRYDIEIDILTTGKDSGEAKDTLESAGYKIIQIPFFKNKLKAFFRLRKFLSKHRYDIIHINTDPNFFLHCLNAWFSGHRVIIRTFHSVFQIRLLGRIRRHVERQLVKLFKVKYISVGKSVAKNEFINFHTKSEIIHNWYNDKKFSIENKAEKTKLMVEIKIPKNTFIITTIGNCSSIKRHELVINALSKLPQTINWLYLHAGKEELGNPERELSEELNINHRCRFLGPIAEVENILAISDVYLMSSKVEGASIAALEAIGSGVPTILTKVPGLSDLLEQIDGLIGVDATQNSIAQAIQYIYDLGEDGRKKLGYKICKQVNSKFSVEKGAKNYANFYWKNLKN